MPESQNIEYKTNWRDEYLKWICGFANANGGKLYIGIDDYGNITGVDDFSELLVQLPNKFRDILGIYAEINLQSKEDKQYLEIIVPRYDVPISLRGKYYIRTGSTLQELKGPALNEFILKRTGKTWDDIPEERASMNDIDESSLRLFLKDARKSGRINVEDDISIPDLMEKLRLSESGHLKRADTDLKFHEVVEGNLIRLKERIGEILNAKFFVHPIDFEGIQRVERDEYPVAAIREMILNALVHRIYMGAQTQIRLYEDHFDVWNDGGLPEGITEEDLKKVHRSKPRNPLIADVCFKGGYIDLWGRGTIKIIEACREAGLPEPVLKEEQGGFLSKIFKDRFTEDQLKKIGLNERQIRAIMYVKGKGSINNSTYREINNIGKSTTTEELQELVEKGIFKREGRRGRAAKYSLKG